MPKLNSQKTFKVGERIPLTQVEVDAIYRNVGVGVILLGTPDLTRGRVFDGEPGKWHFWNVEGKRVHVDISVTSEGPQMLVGVDSKKDTRLPEPL